MYNLLSEFLRSPVIGLKSKSNNTYWGCGREMQFYTVYVSLFWNDFSMFYILIVHVSRLKFYRYLVYLLIFRFLSSSV